MNPCKIVSLAHFWNVLFRNLQFMQLWPFCFTSSHVPPLHNTLFAVAPPSQGPGTGMASGCCDDDDDNVCPGMRHERGLVRVVGVEVKVP